MKNNGGDNACRDGQESTSSPIRDDAKRQYYQANQNCDFHNDRNHGLPRAQEA